VPSEPAGPGGPPQAAAAPETSSPRAVGGDPEASAPVGNGDAPVEHQSFELRWLDPARLRLRRIGGLARLTVEGDRSWTRAAPARAFPISDPNRYIGFLDGAGKDIGIVRDPAEMDEESRRVLEEELELRYFVPVVTKVSKAKIEFGTVYWTVETTRGPREIVVRNLRDNLQELSAIRVLVTDIEGNRFEFPDINQLDPESLGIILRHL